MLKNRDHLFDNLKVLLIFLVVFGHSLEKYINNDSILRSIYIFIFMFHMPLFVYISGYFSKNVDKVRQNSIKDLLIPYIIFNTILYAVEGKYSFKIYYPGWTIWYLLSLFFWRSSLKYLIKIKWILPISIVLGTLVGLVNMDKDLLSLLRTFAFLPFFLLGYYTSNEMIKKIKKLPILVSVIGLAAAGSIAIFISSNNLLKYRVFYMCQSYASLSLQNYKGIVIRFLIYIIATGVGIFIISLMPSKKLAISKIGMNTMVIYLGHIYFIKVINKIVPKFNLSIVNLIFMVLLSVCVVLFLSLPIFTKLYNYVFGKINNLYDGLLNKNEITIAQ